MSRYLVDRILGLSNVEILTQATVTALEGRDGMLEGFAGEKKLQTRRSAGPFDIYFSLSARIRIRIGCPDRASLWTSGALS